MLELKTKNSHDHGTNAIDVSSLPVHSSSLYSRVEDFVFLRFMLFTFILVYHSLVVSEEHRVQVYCRVYIGCIFYCPLFIYYFFSHSHISYMVLFRMLL